MTDPNYGNAEAATALFDLRRRTPTTEHIIAKCYLWAATYAAAFLPEDLKGTPFAGMERKVRQVKNVVRAYPNRNEPLTSLIQSA